MGGGDSNSLNIQCAKNVMERINVVNSHKNQLMEIGSPSILMATVIVSQSRVSGNQREEKPLRGLIDTDCGKNSGCG